VVHSNTFVPSAVGRVLPRVRAAAERWRCRSSTGRDMASAALGHARLGPSRAAHSGEGRSAPRAARCSSPPRVSSPLLAAGRAAAVTQRIGIGSRAQLGSQLVLFATPAGGRPKVPRESCIYAKSRRGGM